MFISLQTLQHQPLPPTVQCVPPVSPQSLRVYCHRISNKHEEDMNAAALPLKHWQKWGKLVPCQWEPGSSRRVGKEPFPGDTGGTEAPERLLWTTGDEYQTKEHDQGLRSCFSWQKQDIGISWGCRTGQWESAQSLGEEEASPSAAASAAGWWKTSEGLQLKCAEFCYKSSLKGVGI